MTAPTEDVTGELPVAGGVLRAAIVPGGRRNEIRSVRFSGDFQSQPDDAARKLEEALAGTMVDEAPGRIEDFFAAHPGAITGAGPGDFLTVLTLAFMKVRRTTSSAPDPAGWKKGEAKPKA